MKLSKCKVPYTLILVVLTILIGFFLVVKIAVAPITVKADQEPEIERDDLDRIIDQLAWCESRNNENAINPHDPDTASYGLLQFKVDTFYRYNEIYRILPDLERSEVLNVIFDGETQKKLSKNIIRDGGWKNWYNCLKPYFG